MPIQNWSQIIVQQLPEAQRKLGITAGGVPATRKIDTASPLVGGGDLSIDRAHSIPKATSAVDGYLAAADFAAFLASIASLLVSIVAAENLPAFGAVTSLGLKADSANPSASFGRVIGLATAFIGSGSSGTVVEIGEITNGGWAWTTGDKIFLNGTALSNTPPVTGFVQPLGTAKGPTIIVVDIGDPVLL